MTQSESLMHSFNHIENCQGNFDGFTKREEFAKSAMVGLLSANATYSGKTDDRNALAKDAVAFADALIEALNTPKS